MKLTSIDINSDFFEIYSLILSKSFNKPMIHQLITAYLSNNRQGSSAQKNRSDVRGGGKKPWRQKGSGRARVGTICSPLWRSGGVTFAARQQDHSKKMNSNMYRATIFSIFYELIHQNRLILINNFNIDLHQTKQFFINLQYIKSLIKIYKVLIITEFIERNIIFATRNIYNLSIIDLLSVNPVTLIKFDKVLITLQTWRKLEEYFI
ncbi:50S ribosomal protein L4 [Candidatus Johnevansia muelleri]|uniref:Large ribosomal subunit protein uL4 n=1 Tax=Candidatus Johnevansia muelleri TaxID=1495769 RepID=A0A078KDT5_9GAMM|nr:50S ribosomal protein L4 [Candidatus Evansia muelleri]